MMMNELGELENKTVLFMYSFENKNGDQSWTNYTTVSIDKNTHNILLEYEDGWSNDFNRSEEISVKEMLVVEKKIRNDPAGNYFYKLPEEAIPFFETNKIEDAIKCVELDHIRANAVSFISQVDAKEDGKSFSIWLTKSGVEALKQVTEAFGLSEQPRELTPITLIAKSDKADSFTNAYSANILRHDDFEIKLNGTEICPVQDLKEKFPESAARAEDLFLKSFIGSAKNRALIGEITYQEENSDLSLVQEGSDEWYARHNVKNNPLMFGKDLIKYIKLIDKMVEQGFLEYGKSEKGIDELQVQFPEGYVFRDPETANFLKGSHFVFDIAYDALVAESREPGPVIMDMLHELNIYSNFKESINSGSYDYVVELYPAEQLVEFCERNLYKTDDSNNTIRVLASEIKNDLLDGDIVCYDSAKNIFYIRDTLCESVVPLTKNEAFKKIADWALRDYLRQDDIFCPQRHVFSQEAIDAVSSGSLEDVVHRYQKQFSKIKEPKEHI